MAKKSEFSTAVRNARKAAGMSQQQVADLVGVSQVMVTHWEGGKKYADYATIAKLEAALGLPAGELAKHLPDDHPAKRMAAVEIAVVGVVAAGIACDAPADPGEVLRVSEQWAGCVAYRVKGDSMTGDAILDGDYLIVRPSNLAVPGSIVVAWVASDHDRGGHVVKRLDGRGFLKSSGKDRWTHKIREEDRVYGVLEGVVRIVDNPVR